MLLIRIRDPVLFWHLDLGSRICFSGYRISDPQPLFLGDISDNFFDNKYHNFCKFFFLYLFKNRIIYNFVTFVATKEVRGTKNFLLFCCCWWIRNPGSKIQDEWKSGSEINSQDPQHCRIANPYICSRWIRDTGWKKIIIRDKHPGL